MGAVSAFPTPHSPFLSKKTKQPVAKSNVFGSLKVMLTGTVAAVAAEAGSPAIPNVANRPTKIAKTRRHQLKTPGKLVTWAPPDF